jgi:hypothetical protein
MSNVAKTLFVTHWPGGGVWGLKQLVQAAYIEEQTGMTMADLSDVNISSSIGSVPGNVLLIPDPKQPNKPKFQANEIIEPFKKCAAELFGPDGIDSHYIQTTKHDLGNILSATPGFTKAALARFLRAPGKTIHKPHHLLEEFLTSYMGNTKMDELLKSSITYAHHMQSSSRVCFANLDTTLFDPQNWNHSILPNHGNNHKVTDVIMASTAAPTVFNAHCIQGNQYVDFDTLYSPLAAIDRVLQCLKPIDQDSQFNNPYEQRLNTKIIMLKVSCGMRENQSWDPIEYANQGPLAMERDLISNMGVDQQRIDHETLKERFGAKNILCLGRDVSDLDEETEMSPSSSPFDGNYSNLDKLEDLSRQHITSQRDSILMYADHVTQTRAKDTICDPTSAFTRRTSNVIDIKKPATPQVGIWKLMPRLKLRSSR